MDFLRTERDSAGARRILIVRAKERFVLLDLYDASLQDPALVLENVIPNICADAAELGRGSVERSIQWAVDGLTTHGRIDGIGCWDPAGAQTGSWSLSKILEALPPAPMIWLA